MADIFSGEADPAPMEVTLNDLVGEGRKYTDPDQLAKAYANVESFAEQLKRENAELRAAKDIKDAELNNQNPPIEREPHQSQTPDAGAPNKQNSSPVSDEDFRTRIKEEVKALNETERAQANLDTVAAKLIEITGSQDGATQAIAKRAQELGVSVEWLRDSAAKSPAAFYASMGINAQDARNRTTPAPVNEFRPNADTNRRDFEFFDKMRKEDPKRYFSAANQREMLVEAKRQGADFYRR